MPFVSTIILFFLAVVIAYLCGYGVSYFLLPKDERAQYTAFLAPALGYAILSWVTALISSALKVQTSKACIFVACALLAITVIAILRLIKDGNAKAQFFRVLKAQLLCVPLVLFVFWPMFVLGADTYLGSVNTDYTYSLFDNHYLEKNPITSFNRGWRTDTYRYTDSNSGKALFSARFGANMFILLIKNLLRIPLQTAMTLAIALFLYCFPLSVFYMARKFFLLEVKASALASVFASISSLTCLSFIYFLIGQNSGLGIFPILLTVAHSFVTSPSRRLMLFTSIMLSCQFIVYAGMLPFALTPAIGAAAILLWRKQSSVKALWVLALKSGATLIGLNLLLIPFLKGALIDWTTLISRSTTTIAPVFLELLTELFFPHYFGILSYPAGAQPFWAPFPRFITRPLLILSVLAICFCIFQAIWTWRQDANRKPITATITLTAIIYLLVWLNFSFIKPNGYFVFKIGTWLQFMVAIPLAYLAALIFNKNSQLKLTLPVRGVCLVALVIFCIGNVIADFQITTMSLGKNPAFSRNVNAFNLSGNQHYQTLNQDIKKYITPGKSIGVSFSEYVQTQLVCYYLRDYKVSVLSNYIYPSIDRVVIKDYAFSAADVEPVVKRANPFFHGLKDDYILTNTKDEVSQGFMRHPNAKPLWSNNTFVLYRMTDLDNFIFSGTGWYVTEYRTSQDTEGSLRQEPFRWFASQAEIFLTHPTKLGASQTLSFDISMAEQAQKNRVEIWINSKLIDAIEVAGSARITTKPFCPDTLNQIIFRIGGHPAKEAVGRHLWNQAIYQTSSRFLSAAVSNIQVMPVETSAPTKNQKDGH